MGLNNKHQIMKELINDEKKDIDFIVELTNSHPCYKMHFIQIIKQLIIDT